MEPPRISSPSPLLLHPQHKQSPWLGNRLLQSQSLFNHRAVSFSAPVLDFVYLQPIYQFRMHFSVKIRINLSLPFLSPPLTHICNWFLYELLPFLSSKIFPDLESDSHTLCSGRWKAGLLFSCSGGCFLCFQANISIFKQNYNIKHQYLCVPSPFLLFQK